MKIVQINAVYKNGSTGRIAMEIHNKLVEKGHSSFVFCSNYFKTHENVLLIGNALDHKLHALFSRLFGLQAYFSVRATKKMLNQLLEIKPEVVHLHNLHNNYINLPLLLKFLAKHDIATVLTLHDCWFFTGHCCHYTEVKCSKWLTGCYKCPALSGDNQSWFFDFSKKIYNDKKLLFGTIPRLAVVGNSQWTTDQANRSFLKYAKIKQRIYNWVNLDVFHPMDISESRKKLGIRDVDFVILGVSQYWNARKGLNVFVELALRFPEHLIILVGSVSSEDKLPKNISCIGRTSDTNELACYYSAADVFISPSLQETFGLVSAEALACGTPIIVNNATANPELAGDGCGYIVSNNNVEQYCMFIEKIKSEGKAIYSEKCCNFARSNFDKNQNIESLESLYHQISNI